MRQKKKKTTKKPANADGSDQQTQLALFPSAQESDEMNESQYSYFTVDTNQVDQNNLDMSMTEIDKAIQTGGQ